jgi:hypothetical protein
MTVADHPTHPPDPLHSQRVRSFQEPAMIRIARTVRTARTAIPRCAVAGRAWQPRVQAVAADGRRGGCVAHRGHGGGT